MLCMNSFQLLCHILWYIQSTAIYIESRLLKAIRTVIDENTLFFFKMFKYYFLDSLSLKTEILPILAILS